MDPFDNSWLLSSWPDSASPFPDGEFGFRIGQFFQEPGCGKTVIQLIRNFQGTKAFVSFGWWAFPGRRRPHQIERVIKRLVGQFDLVLLAPAPYPGSCHLSEQLELSEGGSQGTDRRDRSALMGIELQRSVLPILLTNPELVRQGATTVLPILGTGRWNHPALRLPKLPHPYSEHKGKVTLQRMVAEAILNLAAERMAAEALGATYVNVSSFNAYYADDLAISAPHTHATKGIVKLTVPTLEEFTFADVLSLRNDASNERSAFGSDLLGLRHSDVKRSDKQFSILQNGVRLQDKADALVSRYQELVAKSKSLAGKSLVKSAAFAASASGELGSAAAAIGFLAGGGALWDLVDLITTWRDVHLTVHRQSLFLAAQALRTT